MRQTLTENAAAVAAPAL